jgi:hypothetical protein
MFKSPGRCVCILVTSYVPCCRLRAVWMTACTYQPAADSVDSIYPFYLALKIYLQLILEGIFRRTVATYLNRSCMSSREISMVRARENSIFVRVRDGPFYLAIVL